MTNNFTDISPTSERNELSLYAQTAWLSLPTHDDSDLARALKYWK